MWISASFLRISPTFSRDVAFWCFVTMLSPSTRTYGPFFFDLSILSTLPVLPFSSPVMTVTFSPITRPIFGVPFAISGAPRTARGCHATPGAVNAAADATSAASSSSPFMLQ